MEQSNENRDCFETFSLDVLRCLSMFTITSMLWTELRSSQWTVVSGDVQQIDMTMKPLSMLGLTSAAIKVVRNVTGD